LIATYLHPNVVHLVYDLFPEALIHAGKWREGSLKVRIVRWVVRRTLRRAKTNVFLGARLKDYVESIHGAVENGLIIPVGADQSLFRMSPKQRLSESDPASFQYATRLSSSKSGTGSERVPRSEATKRPDSAMLKTGPSESQNQTPSKIGNRKSKIQSAQTVLYCGNLGNMHDTDTLFDYWRDVSTTNHSSTQPVTFHFNCSGPKRAELEQVVAGLAEGIQSSICVGDGLSQKEWIERMEESEVALVTMAPGSEQVVMPSKTYSAMMAGQALLVIAPEDSDLVDLVKSVDCGWWVKPGDVDALGAVLRELADDAALVLEKRERAFKYAHEHFGQDHIAGAWQALFEKL
jgi:glycosyltransferase involved in cell wall biosynthesis